VKIETRPELLESAIDAIINLEGYVYKDGLPSELRRALERLRRDLYAMSQEAK